MAGKKIAKKRLNINFRQTHSERSATNSYRNFGKYRKMTNYQGLFRN